MESLIVTRKSLYKSKLNQMFITWIPKLSSNSSSYTRCWRDNWFMTPKMRETTTFSLKRSTALRGRLSNLYRPTTTYRQWHPLQALRVVLLLLRDLVSLVIRHKFFNQLRKKTTCKCNPNMTSFHLNQGHE